MTRVQRAGRMITAIPSPRAAASVSRGAEANGSSRFFVESQIGSHREVPKRSNGADCKSAGYAFGGSNPPLSTKGLGWEDTPTGGSARGGSRSRQDRTTATPNENLRAPRNGSPRAAAGVRSECSADQTRKPREWPGDREAEMALQDERAGIAQLARARAFQARGRGFESRFPLHAPEREGPM